MLFDMEDQLGSNNNSVTERRKRGDAITRRDPETNSNWQACPLAFTCLTPNEIKPIWGSRFELL